MQKSYVIGLEGGGTKTRVMVADLAGNVLAYKESGSSHPHKDRNAKENIQEAILGAISEAKIEMNELVHITAGLPGYDQEEDLNWLKPLLDIDNLSCPKIIVNDSEVGHVGAFLFEPGIMAISGTGSNIMGFNENGQTIFNGDVDHYASTAARFLSKNAVFKILAEQVDSEDKQLISQIIQYWETADDKEFRHLASQGFRKDRMERDRLFGQMAPIITEGALLDIPMAREVCDEAVYALETGIRIVGGYFHDRTVKVCFVGSVIRSPYIREKLTAVLEKNVNKDYQIIEPVLSPVAGAVIMSLKNNGININENVLHRLSQHPQSTLNKKVKPIVQ